MLWLVVSREGQYRAIPEDLSAPGWEEVSRGTQEECAKWMKNKKAEESEKKKKAEGGGKQEGDGAG